MTDFGSKFAINTYSYTQSMSAADCLRHLADRGVNAVELMFYPGHFWITDETATINEVRAVAEERGIEILSMNSPNIDLNLAAATKEMREHTLDILKHYVRLTGDLGAAGLVIGPGKPNPLFPLPKATMTGHFLAGLDVLLPLANDAGVALYLENMSFAFLPTADELMALLADYGRDEIKICYDVANAHFINEDIADGLRTVAPRLALVHFSDTTKAVYRHDPIGDGDLDFADLAPALDAVDYKAPVVLEIICNAADDGLRRSIETLRGFGFAS